MKASDIQEYVEYKGCFSEGYEINGVDGELIGKLNVLELVEDILMNDENGGLFKDVLVEACFQMLQFNNVEEESSQDRCDQCGDYNYNYVYRKNKKTLK